MQKAKVFTLCPIFQGLCVAHPIGVLEILPKPGNVLVGVGGTHSEGHLDFC